MFSQTSPQASSLSSEGGQKIIKLVKNPIHMDWIEIHVKCGDENLGYLVMQSTDDSLIFYTRNMQYKISSPVLQELFKDIKSGWSRAATAEDHVRMRDASRVLSSFLPIVEKGTEDLGAVFLP